MTRNIRTTRTPAPNSGLAKVAVSFSADTFEVTESSVLRINNCGKNRHLPSQNVIHNFKSCCILDKSTANYLQIFPLN